MSTQRPPEPPQRAGGDTTYDKYLVFGVAEIRRHLQCLVDGRCTLVGHAEGDTAAVVTVLLRVGPTSLLVDVPRTRQMTEAWVETPRLHFEGSYERIGMRFACGPAWRDMHEGRPALGLPLPSRLLHLQRRDSLRREPPTGALQCRVPRQGPTGESAWIDATIRDIGGGGLAVLAPRQAIAFTVGDVIEGCVIELPELGQVVVNLAVRHVVPRIRGGEESWKAGCEFVGLAQATQDKLFRYVMQLDRDRVAKQKAVGTTPRSSRPDARMR